VEAALVARGVPAQQSLLSASCASASLTLRNWRAGDRFWPAHTSHPKKVKELLQERRIPQEQRRMWPVILCDGEIVWVRGFPVPEQRQPSPEDTHALQIQEIPLQDLLPRRQ
jgi:tRNA(Ile)-lysidine synthetase-like protein